MQPQRVTLPQLLQSRENRTARQRQLLERFRGAPETAIFSFTVNYPGDVKLCDDTRVIHAAGVQELNRMLREHPILHHELRALSTGFEGFWVVQMPPHKAKALACSLEESHPLGRLFDIDVLGRDAIPLGREAQGLPPRGCLLCGGAPAVCRREGRHAVEELKGHIRAMVERWVMNVRPE